VARQAEPVRILLAVLGLSAGIVLLWKWERLSIPVSSAILVIFLPLLPLFVATAAWGLAKTLLDLLLAIMKGEITQPEQLAGWLDHHPPRGKFARGGRSIRAIMVVWSSL
jgi:hypothetical protein